MQPQPNFSGGAPGSGDQSGAVVCSQCGAPMPKEMRFCRTCGNRLGEGSAEYTETVRLPNAPNVNAQFNNQYMPGMGGQMARQAASYPAKRRRLGFTGMTWMWILLGLFFAGGGVMSALVRNVTRGPRIPAFASTPRSYFGVNGFRDADNGATFDVASPPGGPADKAGLVGGDIITSYDGHPVEDEDDLMDRLTKTPIGKTVEVIYTRDGNFHNTQLTTISSAEMDRLREVYSSRSEGEAVFGFDSDKTTVMTNQETGRAFGVRIDWVQQNRPADLFGIKVGDIITDFDSIPIRTQAELLSRVKRAIPKSVVEITLLRDGKVLKIPVTMGKS